MIKKYFMVPYNKFKFFNINIFFQISQFNLYIAIIRVLKLLNNINLI